MDLTTTFQQDFKAFGLAIEQSRSDIAIILSNRFISNVLFADDRRYGVIGFVLRQISKDNQTAEQLGGKPQKTVLESVRTLISDYESLLRERPLNTQALWKKYHDYINSTRKVFLTDPEVESYKDNQELTATAVVYLFQNFLLNKAELGEPGAIVPHGCANELHRMIGVQGISERDLPLYSIVIAISWLYDYVVRYWETGSVDEEPIEKAKARFGSLLEPVRELIDKGKYQDLKALSDPASDILGNILLEWRKEYIRFMEVGSSRLKKASLPLSKETKEKLTETIKGAIDRDILGKDTKK